MIVIYVAQHLKMVAQKYNDDFEISGCEQMRNNLIKLIMCSWYQDLNFVDSFIQDPVSISEKTSFFRKIS